MNGQLWTVNGLVPSYTLARTRCVVSGEAPYPSVGALHHNSKIGGRGIKSVVRDPIAKEAFLIRHRHKLSNIFKHTNILYSNIMFKF